MAGGLAAVTTSMNRVTGVYEREVSVRMQLVANNNLIIYTTAATETYTGILMSKLLEMAAPAPDATTLVLHQGGQTYTIPNYVAMGGNVHFPPGARGHYDLSSPHIVKTVIENYRLRNGPNGQEAIHDFDPARFRQ